METLIVIAILLCIVGGATYYIYREKKRGAACVGCPYAKQCGGKCSGGCGSEKTDDRK